MSRKETRPNQQILEEASAWFVIFRSQDLADSARQEFNDWLKRSPENIRAYLEIASVYADIPAPEHGRTPPELIEQARASPDINVVAFGRGGRTDAAASWLSQVLNNSNQKSRRSRSSEADTANEQGIGRWFITARVVLAVSVLTVAFMGAWLFVDRNTYRTGIGEQRSIIMSDGSIVELNARSKVRIAFADEQRDVELLEGQALFRVAKDQNRPFVVHAGATSVRAVGTRFDVYRKSAGTIVSVLEGRVAVLSPIPAPPTPDPPVLSPTIQTEHLLAAGEQMTVTPTHAKKAERPNIAAATAWTQHQLVFDGTPLVEVIEEFSRYTTRRLVVDTPELGELKISGQYTSTSPDSLLRFLSLQKGVVVAEVSGETHIRQE